MTLQEKKLQVSPLYVRSSGYEISLGDSERRLKLRDFQYKLLEIFNDHASKDLTFLSAPTGSGKTLSLIIPLAANVLSKRWIYHGSIGVYPSRELAADQMVSIAKSLEVLGAERTPVEEVYKDLGEIATKRNYQLAFRLPYGGRRVILLYLTSESISSLREALGFKSNFEVIDYLWRGAETTWYRIVFTVPEYPYLISASAYGADKAAEWVRKASEELPYFLKAVGKGGDAERKWIERLFKKISKYRMSEELGITRGYLIGQAGIFLLFKVPVFFDEFHAYGGMSLPSFLSLLYIYMQEGIEKIVISSATPEKTVFTKYGRKDLKALIKSLGERMGYRINTVEAGICEDPEKDMCDQVRKRTEIELIGVLTDRMGAPAFGAIQKQVPEVLERTSWLSDFQRIGRAMIIVDRVASVREISEKVRKLLPEESILEISSVSDMFSGRDEKQDLRQAKIIVGNMAIAYGIDIEGMDLGVVVAKEAISAIQKIGRVGRGGGKGEAKVYLPVPDYKYKMIVTKRNYKENEIHYSELLHLLAEIYPQQPTEIAFSTRAGLLKILLSPWIYTLSTIARHRPESRAELERARSVDELSYLANFKMLITELERFLGKPISSKIALFARKAICQLTPRALYNLYSFRNIAAVESVVEGKQEGKKVSLMAVARNFSIRYEKGKIIIEEPFLYTNIWIGVDHREKERIEALIEKLKWYPHTLDLVLSMLKDSWPSLYQDIWGGKTGKPITSAINLKELLPDTPILVIPKSKKRVIEKLHVLDNMIPIYAIHRQGFKIRRELLGGIYIL